MISMFKPFMPELPELDDILHSGKLAYGEYSKKFEAILKDYFGTEYVLALNSYSTCFDIIVKLLNLKDDDEVIMSPICCLASSQPIVTNKLKVVWADIDCATGTLLPSSVEQKITSKTKLIIHNHFCGYPGHTNEINSIGKKYSIPVVDDGIEAFGSSYDDKKIGNTGADFTVFSLSAVRFPSTIEGGVLIVKDKELYEKALLMSDLGINRSIFRKQNGEISEDCDISMPGYGAKMSNVNGYIGIKQMEHCDWVLEKQRDNAETLKKLLCGDNHITFLGNELSKPNYWVFGMLVDNKDYYLNLFRGKGLYASSVHLDNRHYSVFNNKTPLPGADYFSEHFIALPSGWFADKEEYLKLIKEAD